LVDRYTDSSEAYQGGGRELGTDTVLAVHRSIARIDPDLTILMDSDVRDSVARARRRNLQTTARNGETSDENRFEQENARFFDRVHQAYLNIAKREPERVYMVDARRDPDTVHEDIVREVKRRLGIATAEGEHRSSGRLKTARRERS
jgi:dTMP kinase